MKWILVSIYPSINPVRRDALMSCHNIYSSAASLFWSAYLSFPLSSQGIVWWCLKLIYGVWGQPTPVCWPRIQFGLSGPVQLLIVWDAFQPPHIEDVPETTIDECLEFVDVCTGFPSDYFAVKLHNTNLTLVVKIWNILWNERSFDLQIGRKVLLRHVALYRFGIFTDCPIKQTYWLPWCVLCVVALAAAFCCSPLRPSSSRC